MEKNPAAQGQESVVAPSLLSVTPVILTLDEEANLGRTLSALTWARRVVVLDSGSSDGTERVARSFDNVDFSRRPFDCLRRQWEAAFERTGRDAEYLLALDADMIVTPQCVDEIERDFLPNHLDGGVLPIRWCYYGRPLRGSLCAPQLRLFHRSAVTVGQRGHAHAFFVEGSTRALRHGVLHDDRKPVDRWIASQLRYSREEAERIQSPSDLRLQDRLRATCVMPVLAVVAAYLRAGGPLGGRAALRYAYERGAYEALLAIRLLDGLMGRAGSVDK